MTQLYNNYIIYDCVFKPSGEALECMYPVISHKQLDPEESAKAVTEYHDNFVNSHPNSFWGIKVVYKETITEPISSGGGI